MWNKVRQIIFLMILSFHFICPSVQAEENPLILDGIRKFSPGDDLAWASPAFNDAQWQTIRVPGSWQSQNIKSIEGMGWYRIHFFIPADIRYSKPAVFLGRIGDADEVFLNGVRIGGEGVIGRRFVEATKIQRLYQIPSDVIKYNGNNVLAVRVMNTYLNGGIFDKNLFIGEYSLFLMEKNQREKYPIVVEFCLFTFFFLFSLACLFFYLKGLRDKEYISFWVFTILYSSLFILGSVTFYNAGLKSPAIQQAGNFLSTLLPAGLFLLLIYVYQMKFQLRINIVMAMYLILAAAISLFPQYSARVFFLSIWKIVFGLTAIYILMLSVRGYLRKFNEAGPILLGVTGLVAGLILESIGGLDLLHTTGFFLWDYSTVFFMICIMYTLAARYTRIQKELMLASVRIFDAHEEERKRLARELHDGIGQSLLSLKLRLKMFDAGAQGHKKENREEIKELITDISGIIGELKSVAMDLRPSFLENAELAEAITWHAGRIQEKFGVLINVTIRDSAKIDSKVKDNIYRIFQEALSNATQHSEASSIDVIVGLKGKNLFVEIKDNGKGFDIIHGRDGRKGIGLYTIKERVELLGGILKIKSSDQKGTTLSIEVPVE